MLPAGYHLATVMLATLDNNVASRQYPAPSIRRMIVINYLDWPEGVADRMRLALGSQSFDGAVAAMLRTHRHTRRCSSSHSAHVPFRSSPWRTWQVAVLPLPQLVRVEDLAPELGGIQDLQHLDGDGAVCEGRKGWPLSGRTRQAAAG